jgi:putative spermidine/putrescine transport system permease protein
VYRVPIVLPHIVVAFLVLLFLGREGVFRWGISTLLPLFGIDAVGTEIPELIYTPAGTGMILAYVYKEFPFVILLVHGALRQISPRFVTTGKQLGAGEMTVFLRVVLPQILNTVVQAFAVVFLYGFGAFEIPYLLGNSDPQMIPVFVFNTYFHSPLARRPVAMAVLVSMTIVVVLIGAILIAVGNRMRRWKDVRL